MTFSKGIKTNLWSNMSVNVVNRTNYIYTFIQTQFCATEQMHHIIMADLHRRSKTVGKYLDNPFRIDLVSVKLSQSDVRNDSLHSADDFQINAKLIS